MRRCDYCGGKLGLIVHRKWRLRFCKLACKTSHEVRQRQQIRYRRRRLVASTSMSATRAVLHRYQAVRERVGFGLLPLNPMCNPFEACFVPVASFGRSSIFRATKGYAPPKSLRLESLPQLPSTRSLSSLSIIPRMRSLFLPLSRACAGILRKASARISELQKQVEAAVLVTQCSRLAAGPVGEVSRSRCLPEN